MRMKDFFTSLLYASVAGGLAAALAGKTFEKYIKYISALLCAAVITAPLLSLLPGIRLALPEEKAAFASADAPQAYALLEKQACQDAEAAAADLIFSETGIKPISVSIQMESVDGKLYIRSVKARLPSAEDAAGAESYLKNLFGKDIPVEVTIV